MREHYLLPMLLLAACAPTPVPTAAAGGTCDANGLDRFVGQVASEAVGAEIRTASGALLFRWLPRGSIVTMEFNPERVSARLDGQNRIEGVTCG